MNRLHGWNTRVLSALVIGTAALASCGVNNIISAYNDPQQVSSSSDFAPAAISTLKAPAGGYDPGSPFCNPAGCAACGGCSTAQYTRMVSEDVSSVLPVSLASSSIWNSCTRGRVNCEYPGDCHSYIDTNRDAICDRSQSAPARTSAPTSKTVAANAAVSSETAATPAATPNTLSAELTVPAATGTFSDTAVNNTPVVDSGSETGNTDRAVTRSSYYFIPILIVLAIVYATTWILSQRRIIGQVMHRRIWNLVLLFSTLASALLGLFLILRLDFDIDVPLPFNMLFWHVEAGIAMGIVAVFHILWHWRYFAKLFKASPAPEKAMTIRATRTAEVHTRSATSETTK